MMEGSALAETQAVSMPMVVVRAWPLLLPEEETHGLLEALMNGAAHRQLRQSEEEVKTAGRCCLVHHPWADGHCYILPESLSAG